MDMVDPTIARDIIWNGGVAKVLVARDAAAGAFAEFKYFRFNRGFKGGMVSFFVHSENPEIIGREITVSVQLMQRTLQDGRKYLYVDLKPTRDVATLRIMVADSQQKRRIKIPEGSLVFDMPAPLAGAVMFLPIDAKIEEAETATVDPQLERLLNEGWEPESQDARTVTLIKMKGGQKKQMIHHRPK